MDPLEAWGNSFHFHSPSEHTIDDKKMAMEMHIVHDIEDKEVLSHAVSGIFMDVPKYPSLLSDTDKRTMDLLDKTFMPSVYGENLKNIDLQ